MKHMFLIAGWWLAVPLAAWAQIESGPAAGTKLEPFKAAILTGEKAGEEQEIGQGTKDQFTLYLWVNKDTWDRPIARFVRELDVELQKDHKQVQVYFIWLTDQVDQGKEYLPRVQESLKLKQTTFTVFPGEKQGPLDWSINADAHLTVVIAKGDQAKHSLAFRSTNETDVKKVLDKLKLD